MFRLIRLTLLLVVAFVAGIIYERGQAKTRCTEAGGMYNSPGICTRTGDQG